MFKQITFKWLFLFFSLLAFAHTAWSCTRALWASDKAIVVGRTMDWSGDMMSNLWVFPRGIERDGLADVNSVTWRAKYGSIVTTAYDEITTDGMNEKGFAVHIFWLVGTDYGKRDVTRPGLSILMWGQYLLDNFASVDEAVRFTQESKIQLEPYELEDSMQVHMVLDDGTGDSAVIEYINGEPHIYHGHAYTTVTNAPTYDKHLANLRSYRGFGGNKALPGTTDSVDRFVRAAFYSKYLPQPKSPRDAIAKILSVTYNTAMPYGTSSAERTAPSETIWMTALDLSNRVYYFISTSTNNLIWANLDKLNLHAGAPVLKLDIINRTELAGDITDQFETGVMLKNPRLFKFHAGM